MSSEPESSESDQPVSSAPEPSEPCPESPESSETALEAPEPSGLVLGGTLNSGALDTCVDDVDGRVVDVVGLVVDVTEVGTGSSGGTGFCHTDRDVGAPMLGNSVSRIA